MDLDQQGVKFMRFLIVLLLLAQFCQAEEKHYGSVRKVENSSILADIDAHVDPKHGTYYRDASLSTWGHECTHAINADLRIKELGQTGQLYNCFYLLNNKYYRLKQYPGVRLEEVGQIVPKSLRSAPIYKTYFVDSLRDWNDTPTYIFDEHSAYINGTYVTREYELPENSSGQFAALFSVYSCCVLMTYDSKNVNYDRADYVNFLKIQIDRLSPKLKDSDFVYAKHLDFEPDCVILRKYIRDNFGEKYYRKLFGEK